MPRLGRMRAKPSVITLADRARDAGQWKGAAVYYREALRRNPQNPPIWVQYGHVLKESGHLIEAERAYRTAVAYDPCIADSHLQLGHVLKIQGKNEDARAAYFRAIALDPSLDGASFEMAEIGWSKAHFSELRGMLFMDMAGPMALASVHGTSGEHPPIQFAQQPVGRMRDDPGSRRSPKNPSAAMVETSGQIFSPSLDPGESEDARLISQSGLFDAAWYLEKNKDLQSTAVDPLVHYLRSGAREGRDPHPLFDSDWYLATNQDVAASGVNPLVHYLRSGVAEGRAPNPVLQSVFTRAAGHRVLPTTRKEVYSPDLFELRGLVPHGRIAVVLHLYYPDLWAELRQAIERISEPFDLFVSLVKGASEHMRTSVKQVFPNAYIFDFENRGRDIGPFLVLIQSGVLFQYELVCKLHTKRSPHREDGDEWRGTLIGGILGSPSEIDLIVSSFRSDPDIGMVVADGNIYRGHHHWASNERLLVKLLLRIGISPDVRDRAFPGGSIFWIRPLLLRTLASARISIADFEPEPVEEDGSLPHAVERMFGLICEDAGMRVVETRHLKEIASPPDNLANVHLIAFYLPQFHPIPENDKWWGVGFTEWANVTRAKPLFNEHRQPRLPSDLGFYDLRVPEVRAAQAQLARRYGLAAFCYYYYWFRGQRILQRPLDEVMASGEPTFPFLICWANEPWTRNWDGLSRDILLPQTYEPGWTRRFASDIAPLLRDRRYFRLDGKPMVLVYRVGHIPEARAAMRELRAALSEQGIPHVHLAAAWVWFPEDYDLPADPSILDLDAYFEIPPHWLPSQALQPTPPGLSGEFNGELYDYNRTVTVALAKLDEPIVGLRHRGVMTAWDSTARKGSRAAVFHAATPTSFRRWLRGTIAHERRQQGERVVFINAWNEWAEGTYLEPDNDFGCGWLEAVASVSDVEWLSTQPPGSRLETDQHRSQSSISSNLDRAEPALGHDKTYHLWAKTLSDDEWCNFLAGTGMPRHTPPPLPPEKFQTAWVGNAGIDTFREAMEFCRLLKSTLALADYRLGSDSRLLDIGVGWGRIYRTLLRETPHIIGIDVVPECIELCRSALPGGQFELSSLAPPYRFSDGEFDVAYLYSVFSHLNETLFLAILREAARVVREGGFVVFTTIGPSDEIMQRNGFAETWRADASAGRFLFLPTGGGHESMSPWVWGWAHLSEPYLRRILPDFPLRLVAYEPNRLMQAFVALQKQ